MSSSKETKEQLPPIDALAPGKILNAAVDRLFRDGLTLEADLQTLHYERHLVLYIYEMAKRDEVRLEFDEWGRLHGMIRANREAIEAWHKLNDNRKQVEQQIQHTTESEE